MQKYHDLLVEYSDYLEAKKDGAPSPWQEGSSLLEQLGKYSASDKNLKTLVNYLATVENAPLRERIITMNTNKEILRVPKEETESVALSPMPLPNFPSSIQEETKQPVVEMVEEVPVQEEETIKIFQKTNPPSKIAGFIDALTLAWISGMVGGAFLTIMFVIIS